MTRFAAGPDFDPRVADWLEGDPDRAPEQVLETVFAAFPSIPQRRATRLPWRPTSMIRFALGAAAVVSVVLVGGALLLRPSPGTLGGPAPVPSVAASIAPSVAPPAPSAASASPQVAACGLLTTSEVATFSGNPGLGAIAAGSGPGEETSCRFNNGAGDIIARLTFTKPGGTAAFESAKARSGVQTVEGLGSAAVFDPASGTLFVTTGDALVAIVSGTAADPSALRLDGDTRLARLIVDRM
jgi:hypothetical protein